MAKYCTRLRTAMNFADISQTELCARTQIPKSALSQYLSGAFEPKEDRKAIIAKTLGVSELWLEGFDVPMRNDTACDKCGYSPMMSKLSHEEYHKKWEKAVEKYGFYYAAPYRDDHRSEMDAILSTNPPLDKQIECQTEILKCLFSKSLFAADYDLKHCSFNDYVSMILGQKYMCIRMSDECKAAMVETYGKKRGIPKGKFYQIPDETDSDDIFKYPNIKPIKKVKIPMLGNVACGEPTFADEEHETYIETDGHINADFCLICDGDSMEPKLMNGDIVFIRKQPEVNDGQIAAVLIEDEATLKRVYYDKPNNVLTLVAENPKYRPFIYSGEQLDHIRIIGKAVSLYRRIKQ